MSEQNDIRVHRQLLELYYRQLPIMLIANIMVAVLVVLVMWNSADRGVLSAWMVANVVVVSISWLHARWYRGLEPGAPDYGRWNRHLGAIAVGFGLVWGLGFAALVNEQNPLHIMFLLVVVIGVSTGAMASVIVYRSFVFTMMTIIGVRLLLMDDLLFVTLGIMAMIYSVATLLIIKPLHDSLSQSLQLRFQNLELLENLKAKMAEADQANIEKSRFLAAASHDLRQPLHALDLFAGDMARYVDNVRGREVLDQIRGSLDSLRMLVDSLLDISKLDTGSIEVNQKHIGLAAVFSNLENEFASVASERHRSILFGGNGPAIYCDEALLTSVLHNLIQNALIHGEGDINVGWVKFGGVVAISVSDQGPGIPEDEQRNIFSEFYQLGNPERDRSKGLGLGLAIAHRISMLLGHNLTLKSQAGKGSTFVYSVPAGNPALVEESQLPETDAPELHALNILIVEDELIIQQAMKQLLEGWNCVCWNAEDLAGSLALLDQGVEPDLLISDYRLRGTERGNVVADEIRRRVDPDLPVILVTGDTSQNKLGALSEENVRVLHKPVPPDRLKRAIHEMVGDKPPLTSPISRLAAS